MARGEHRIRIGINGLPYFFSLPPKWTKTGGKNSFENGRRTQKRHGNNMQFFMFFDNMSVNADADLGRTMNRKRKTKPLNCKQIPRQAPRPELCLECLGGFLPGKPAGKNPNRSNYCVLTSWKKSSIDGGNAANGVGNDNGGRNACASGRCNRKKRGAATAAAAAATPERTAKELTIKF